jgi:glycosyltransferase involved in cell wall biosynthesis
VGLVLPRDGETRHVYVRPTNPVAPDVKADGAPSVTVVIPTLNEAESIEWVLRRIPHWVEEVIVIDGHSTDGTAEAVEGSWPDVQLVRQVGRGKGDALRQGFELATCDVIVMLDADGSTDPGEIPRFLAALRTGADFAKGTRYITGGGSADITPARSWGNRAFTVMVNRFWGAHFSDLCYGYNAFWRRDLATLMPDCTGFEVETLLCIRLLRSGLKVVEIPSFEHPRIAGATKLSAVRDGSRVLRTIVAERLRPEPGVRRTFVQQ